eukprot:jgi/Mesen1/6689/ME000343S05866
MTNTGLVSMMLPEELGVAVLPQQHFLTVENHQETGHHEHVLALAHRPLDHSRGQHDHGLSDQGDAGDQGQSAACEWTQSQTFKLLDIWHDKLVEINGDQLRSRDYQSITDRFNEGVIAEADQRSVKQIQAKVEGLKKTYNKRKLARSSTGKNRKSWMFFEKLDEMLGGRPGATVVNGGPGTPGMDHNMELFDDGDDLPVSKAAKRLKRPWPGGEAGASGGSSALGRALKQVGEALSETLAEWKREEKEFRIERMREERVWRTDMMKMQMEHNAKMAELLRGSSRGLAPGGPPQQ